MELVFAPCDPGVVGGLGVLLGGGGAGWEMISHFVSVYTCWERQCNRQAMKRIEISQ